MNAFKSLLLASIVAGGAVFGAAPALADTKSEAYVQAKAQAVLYVVNDTSLDEAGRRAKFREYMNTFAHIPSIAKRVLGRPAKPYTDAQFAEFQKAFENYSIAVYEAQLDQFIGEQIRVVGSEDVDARRSKVKSIIKSSSTGQQTQVIWDVLLSNDGVNYRVRDLGINLDGSVLWLAQQQQADFAEYLERREVRGDITKLTAHINTLTAKLEARRKAGAASTLSARTKPPARSGG